MSFRVCGSRVIAFTLVCLSVASCFAQPAVIETLFDNHPGRGRSGKQSFTLNTTASRALAKRPGSVTVKNFPLAQGQTANFELSPARIFESDAQIIAIGPNGQTEQLPIPAVQAWYGRDLTGGQRSLFMVSRSDGSLGAIVTGDSFTSDTIVLPDESGVVYTAEAGELPDRDVCGVGDELVPDADHESHDAHGHSEAVPTAAATSGMRQIDLMLDITYPTYQKLGSSTDKVNDYVTQLIGAVSSIYRRDLNVDIKVSSLYIWTTPDPFNNPGSDSYLSSSDQLTNYRNYIIANRAGVTRDLAHLVNYNTSLGGIAYVDALCRNEYGVGVSNVYANLNFPSSNATYYWDTFVVAHEMGHNVGSPHTHCYSPPIDCCYVQSGCSECSSSSPAAGTIMSYCHLQFGKGGSVQMQFHPRVIDRLRTELDSASCVTAGTAEPRIEVSGKQAIVIKSGDMNPALEDGTNFSTALLNSGRVTQTFTITNAGSQDLAVSGVSISGSSLFYISAQPAAVVAPAQSTSFAISYYTTVLGKHDAVVTVNSNDPTMPRHTFAISAEATHKATPQTFHYRGSANIPDGNPQGVTVQVPVSNVGGSIMDLDFAINGSNCADPAQVGLYHTYVGDLRMVLESPSGTKVTLFDSPGSGSFGSSANHFCGTVFDDESGGPSIEAISPSGAGQLTSPHSGHFTPHQPLSTFYGENPNGIWKIHVYDKMTPEPGILRAASLTITGSQSSVSSSVGDWQNY